MVVSKVVNAMSLDKESLQWKLTMIQSSFWIFVLAQGTMMIASDLGRVAGTWSVLISNTAAGRFACHGQASPFFIEHFEILLLAPTTIIDSVYGYKYYPRW